MKKEERRGGGEAEKEGKARKRFCRCSASPSGVNQVDGLPPVPNVFFKRKI